MKKFEYIYIPKPRTNETLDKKLDQKIENDKKKKEYKLQEYVDKGFHTKEEDEKAEDKIICKCGNDTFRVYCTVVIDDARLYCSKCGKDPEE